MRYVTKKKRKRPQAARWQKRKEDVVSPLIVTVVAINGACQLEVCQLED